MWLLVLCSVAYHGAAFPVMTVVVAAPTEAVCLAAKRGANDEGFHAVECISGDAKVVLDRWTACGQTFYRVMTESEYGSH